MSANQLDLLKEKTELTQLISNLGFRVKIEGQGLHELALIQKRDNLSQIRW